MKVGYVRRKVRAQTCIVCEEAAVRMRWRWIRRQWVPEFSMTPAV